MKKPKSSTLQRALSGLVILSMSLGCGGDGGDSGSSSGNLDCSTETIQQYFGDTCASGLGDMLACWGPSGSCNAEVDLSGYDIVFDNGAVLEHTYTDNGRNIDARYVSASGELCGTFETVTDFTSSEWAVAFTTSDGEQYEMRPTGDANDYEIACPNGDTVQVTTEQQQELQNCAGGDALSVCTQPDNINPGDYDDVLDAIGRPCTQDSECPSGGGVTLVCCDLFGEQVCYESLTCSLL